MEGQQQLEALTFVGVRELVSVCMRNGEMKSPGHASLARFVLFLIRNNAILSRRSRKPLTSTKGKKEARIGGQVNKLPLIQSIIIRFSDFDQQSTLQWSTFVNTVVARSIQNNKGWRMSTFTKEEGTPAIVAAKITEVTPL